MFSLLLLSLLACAHALLAAIPTGGLIALASQPQFWAVLLAPLNSVAVSVIKQPGTPKWAKVALMVVCSLGLGLLSVYAVGQFNPADLLTTFGLAIAATELAYRKLLRKTGVSIDIEALTILPWIHKAFLAAKAAEEAEAAAKQLHELSDSEPPSAEGDAPAA